MLCLWFEDIYHVAGWIRWQSKRWVREEKNKKKTASQMHAFIYQHAAKHTFILKHKSTRHIQSRQKHTPQIQSSRPDHNPSLMPVSWRKTRTESNAVRQPAVALLRLPVWQGRPALKRLQTVVPLIAVVLTRRKYMWRNKCSMIWYYRYLV